MFKKYAIKFFLGFLLLVVISVGLQLSSVYNVAAQSDSSVRSELVSLRSRISRLESEVRSLAGSRGNQRTTSPSPAQQRNTPQIVNGELVGESDPMFERLATLVIELREDIRTLQKRVTTLEGKLKR